MYRVAWFCLFLFALTFSVVGCKGPRKDDPTYDVSGTVTIDGVPLKDGYINFESEKPDGQAAASSKITDGNYATKSRVGKKKVVIAAERPTGEKNSAGGDITVNWLPDRYHAKSVLTAEIAAPGPNKFDFQLKK